MRYLLYVFVLFFISFAQQKDSCFKRLNLSYIDVLGSNAIAISDDKMLYFSKVKPTGYDILKYDPFLNLYILKSKKDLRPVNIKLLSQEVLKEPLFIISRHHKSKAKVITRANVLDGLSSLDVPSEANSALSWICYHVFGIGTGENGLIESQYIDRFIDSPSIYYGDIGIRINDKLEVQYKDPFIKNNPFHIKDKILSINSKKILTKKEFYDIVMDLPFKSKVAISTLRDSKKTTLDVIADKRYGGGFLTDTFLERFGVAVDNNMSLKIKKALPPLDKLKNGDIILEVNQKKVSSINDIKKHLSRYIRDDSLLVGFDSTSEVLKKHGNILPILIRRDGLDFYVNINMDYE